MGSENIHRKGLTPQCHSVTNPSIEIFEELEPVLNDDNSINLLVNH